MNRPVTLFYAVISLASSVLALLQPELALQPESGAALTGSMVHLQAMLQH